MKYDITITETLQKTFEVEAPSLAEAKKIAEKNYFEEADGFILDSENITDFDIDGHEQERVIEIKIYQINADRDHNSVMFERFDNLPTLQNSVAVDSAIYDKVFEGEVKATDLEDIYRIFNINQPENFKARSLSVSDIVEIVNDENINPGFYFCDSMGFRSVGFDPTATRDRFNEQNTIRVVYFEPGKIAEIRDIDSSLEGMQEVVGGCIEAGYFFDGPECVIVNDEGKLNGMGLNRGIYDADNKLVDILAGPAFICDCSGENFGSLDEARLKQYFEKFKYPEEFFRINGEIRGMHYKPEKDAVTYEAR